MATTTTSAKRPRAARSTISIGPGGPWHDVAPARVRRAYDADEAGWDAWQHHLDRRPLRSIGRLLGGRRSPLLWSPPPGNDVGLRLVERLAALDSRARRRPGDIDDEVARWLAAADDAPRTAGFGLECLAWCWALVPLAARLDERLWWNLLNRLAAIAGQAAPDRDDRLAWQLLSGELPLSLAYWFPELRKCRALAAPARATITAGFAEMLDGRGMPRWPIASGLRPLLASWTRSRALGDCLAEGWCARQAAGQYRPLVQNALRLSRAGGQAVFAGRAAWDADFVKALVRLAGGDTQRLWRLTARGSSASPPPKTLPAPSRESERAGIALLRSDWRRSSPALSVGYAGCQTAVELSQGAQCLCSGIWGLDVRISGQRLLPLSDWEQNCWISDAEVDYLELEIKLSEEVTVERHILLARQDRVLLLADAVLGIQDAPIEYRGSLPLAGYSRFAGEAETREGMLVVDRRPLARVLPLALPEWRTERSRGGLHETEGTLELAQAADGECLFAPLWIDLDAGRIRREATWRQLTVAEDRQIVPADVAVGYRAQVGKAQWLWYRSLAEPGIRSVLGKNLMHQFLLGRVLPSGLVETLVEIDST